MCNPKPQKRCMTDAATALDNKMTDLNTVAERIDAAEKKDRGDMSSQELGQYLNDLSEVQVFADEVERRKVFLYASSKAQSDPQHVIETVSAKNADLNPTAQDKLRSDENALYRTGQYLNKFQAKAESFDKTFAKDDEHKQVKVARAMYNGGFKAVHQAMQAKLRYDRDAKLGAILTRTGSDEPNAETEEVEETYRENMARLEDAYEYARRDAHDVVSKDMKDNSGSYFNPMQGDGTTYRKNVDGSFTITSKFSVPEKNYEKAMDSVEDSFHLEDVQITTSPSEEGYDAKASYVLANTETLADATKFHTEKAFAGTPHWRFVMADIERVQNLPPIRK